jgi:hypothetical protein
VDALVVIRTRRGKDGRDYPVEMPTPVEWRWRAIVLTHELVHGQGLSIRQAQFELLRRGFRRARGSIAGDLERKMPTCPRCRVADGG